MTDQPPVDEESFTPSQRVVADVNAAFYQAVEDGDLDSVRALWIDGEHAANAHCVHPGQPAVHGRTQVLMSWAVVMSRLSYLQFFITDVRVTLIGDVAIVTCVENVLTDAVFPDSASDEERADPAVFAGGRAEAVNIFRHDARAGWRLFAHHSSPVFPASRDR